jgi:hypothetical protein
MFNKLASDEIYQLSERNLSILNSTWAEYAGANHKNVALLDGREISPEFLAYHVGGGNQELLIARHFNHPRFSLNHVFFSSDTPELEFYLNTHVEDFLDSDSKNMVYFIDLRTVAGRVQINYKSRVIFQDEIATAESEFSEGSMCSNDLVAVFDEWLSKNTIAFNPTRLGRLSHKNKGDYILVRSPIKVALHPAVSIFSAT